MSLTNKPHLIDAVIGNSKLLASLGKDGRIYRLWWPHVDYPQHVDIVRNGLLIDGRLTWFDDEQSGWSHQAAYEDGTNIVSSHAHADHEPVAVTTQLFAVPGQDVVVRHLTFHNRSDRAVSLSYIHYSSFHIHENPLYNTVSFDEDYDAMMHFRREYFFMVGGSNVCTKYQAGASAWDSVQRSELNGSKIDMSSEGTMSWELMLEPGSKRELTVYITAGLSQQEARAALQIARKEGYTELFDRTFQYWDDFLSQTVPCPIDDESVRKLYERSLLTMKLMSDEQTGAVIAAPEVDEWFTQCGGYAYCWGRDAAFIASAMDRSGLQDLSDRFFAWSIRAQSSDGSWQQRHYHDGKLAPSWGLQIDEGASILWGMWQHYVAAPNEEFAAKVWPAVRQGAEFLCSFIDAETGLPMPSKDLWEERTAEHSYSSAAVYGGLTAAASFAELQQMTDLASKWRSLAEHIRSQIYDRCWNEEKSSFLRGLKLEVDELTYYEAIKAGKTGYIVEDKKNYKTFILWEDPIVDVSLLGLSHPFDLFPVDDSRMRLTADTIERLLTVPGVGGIKRYEDDPYIGGNPWILTTLWLCQFRIRQGDLQAAKSLLQWAIDHQTKLGLLPEQVDRHTGETAWIVPLTWSHAMFVLAIHMLAEAEADKS